MISGLIEFKREVLRDDEGNDLAMMVAPPIHGSSVDGPVYLTESALNKMLAFIENKSPISSLVLIGPPKCSKTTMLHEVLPRLVVASNPDKTPVFVRIVFPLNSTPTAARQQIREELDFVSNAFGIGATMPSAATSPTLLVKLVEGIAKGLQKQGRRLWLLIDESQVIIIIVLALHFCIHWIFVTGATDQCKRLNGEVRIRVPIQIVCSRIV